MTPAEIEKEAERKLAALADDVTMQMVDPKSQGWQEAYGYVLNALRAVHDAGYRAKKADSYVKGRADGYKDGFNAAIEKILRIGDDNHPEFKDIHPQLRWFLEKIRALKIGDAQ